MFTKIQKRDGTFEDFSLEHFTNAVESAASAVNENIDAYKIARDALTILEGQHSDTSITTVEDALDALEISLMKNGHVNVAKAFIIYRNHHNRTREQNSVFTKAIDNVSLNFEIRGNAAEWLWEVAHTSSYYYTLYKILPQRISHYFTENYIWIHGLPYFGRTLRNISYNLHEIFNSTYFEQRNMNPAKRVNVLVNHILQLMESIHDDIGGEQVYNHFDTSIEKLINRLPQNPTKAEIQQAAEYFIYALNNKSRSHTSNTITGPCLNIGLEQGENSRIFIKYMIKTIDQINLSHRNNIASPSISYILHDEVNCNEDAPNYDIFISVLNLAAKRGNITFTREQDKVTFSSGYNNEVNQSVNLQLTLNLPKIALNSKGNFYDSFHNVINVVEEIVTLNQEMLSGKDVDNFPTISKLPINNQLYDSSEKFSKLLERGQTVIAITGLVEAIKILNPEANFTEISSLAEELLTKIKKRIYLQNKEYKLMVSNDMKITNGLFNGERQRPILSQKGITQYSTGISILPNGYSVKDRIEIEKSLYSDFDIPVPVIIQKEKGRDEILDGINVSRDLNVNILIR